MNLGRTLALGLVFVSAPAWAVAPPAHLEAQHGLQAFKGGALRNERPVTWSTPRAAAAAWARFQLRNPSPRGRWRAQWDSQTALPTRILGPGVQFSGSSGDPSRAADAAIGFVSDNLELLAPGAQLSDFELVSNTFDPASKLRTVGFVQRHEGMEVLGGQLSVRIKNDRLFVIATEALPNIEVTAPSTIIDADKAQRTAMDGVRKDFGSTVQLRGSMQGPFVLPLLRQAGAIDYRVVVRVTVDAQAPVGRYDVFLDAMSGETVAREQTLRFISGTVLFNTPERRPGGTRTDNPAPFVRMTVGGQQIFADAAGVFNEPGNTPLQGDVSPRGGEMIVINDAGNRATQTLTLNEGDNFVWDARDEETVDAQLTTYVAGNLVKDYAKGVAPTMGWLFNESLQATVNIANTCNAFSDGTTINFFRAGNQCDNTGRLPDVVYHEFGHSFHAHAIIRGVGAFDGALSEGASDYIAATITNDPGMGRGFFYTNAPLRHLNDRDRVWPQDIGESHQTGIIYGGAMWDLRDLLITSMGEQAGVSHADDLWYQALQRSSDIPASYVETLAADDDDGDLSNGTPNQCLIDDAFARHGLADPTNVASPIGRPNREDFRVTLPIDQAGNVCPGTGVQDAELVWRLREDSAVGGQVPFTSVAVGLESLIPTQTAGEVVQYQVRVTLENGEVVSFPNNAADPYYEFYVGEVVNLYCTDFESDPDSEGWSHELLQGEDQEGADDWQWGAPVGVQGSGDPSSAYSGERVYGNDLGGGNYNGQYQPNKVNVLHAPPIDVMAFSQVRLQYRRWLNVEDAQFDRATIESNGQEVWSNLDTGPMGDTHHEDREWRFHDVDLSGSINNGQVQVDFKLSSDGGLNMGGWTIDDFCIVAIDEGPVVRCGDGVVDPGEACDDGNKVAGDGCENDCTPTPAQPACGDGNVDPGEACDDGNLVSGDGCESNCTITPDGPMMPMCPGDPSCMDPMMPMMPEDPDPETPPELRETVNGCGCTASETGAKNALWGLVLLLGLGLTRRRR